MYPPPTVKQLFRLITLEINSRVIKHADILSSNTKHGDSLEEYFL